METSGIGENVNIRYHNVVPSNMFNLCMTPSNSQAEIPYMNCPLHVHVPFEGL